MAARRRAEELLVREASRAVLAARAVCSGLQGQMWNALAACLAACKCRRYCGRKKKVWGRTRHWQDEEEDGYTHRKTQGRQDQVDGE